MTGAMVLRSPDCRDGNHQKCDGVAWDMVLDALAGCRCSCHSRPAQ